MNPLFSIITINYNNEAGLRRTVDSVLAQKFTDYEYLIIDGGSTDGSVELIRDCAKSFSYWVSEKDGGVYDAMNKGIACSKGRYLLFLNSGDALVDATVLQKCSAVLSFNGDIDLLYGHAYVSAPLSKNNSKLWQYPHELTLSFFKNSTLNHQATLIKAGLFKELGHYEARYKLAADYAFFLKSLLHDKKYAHINSVLVNYELGGVSATDNFEVYVSQMQSVWDEMVPRWAQKVVKENIYLAEAASPRLVKWAVAINKFLKRLLK